MNLKTFFIRGAIATVINFVLGYVFYAKLFAGYLSKLAGPDVGAYRPQDQVPIWSIFVSCLTYSLLLSLLFTKGNVNTLKEGIITGAVAGFLYNCSLDFNLYAFTNMFTMEGIVADTIIFTVLSTIMGAAISMVGRKDKALAGSVA